MDITTATCAEYKQILAAAFDEGRRDEMSEAKPATAEQLLARLGVTQWRFGHRRALRSMYTAGRFHVQQMGLDASSMPTEQDAQEQAS